MSSSERQGVSRRHAGMAAALLLAGVVPQAGAAEPKFPITADQRNRARQVADAGVPLSELAPNAPDSHTVQRGDTLWGISSLFLLRPWRWPELWGMNIAQIRNPHLIYPGQVLFLDKSGGRARLRMGNPGEGDNTVKLSPRVRSELLGNGAIAAIPMHLIGPFLNEAVVFNSNELDVGPRVVAAPEGRVLMARGDMAYVRGNLGGAREFRLFRELKPLVDPETREVLGHEGRFVGTAEFVRAGVEAADEKAAMVPTSFNITSTRLEVVVGDRLSPVPQQELEAYVPHPPATDMDGRIVAVYGDGLRAGQNQVVSLNRGQRDGLERGHVLALWRAGRQSVDTTDGSRTALQLPDERHGLLFVFRVFERVSYALIVNVQQPVGPGDRFSQP